MKKDQVKKGSRESVISFRLEKSLAECFDKVCSIQRMGKTALLTACIRKLCMDNEIELKHYGKIPEYIVFIKNGFAKLSPNMLIVKNGTWKNMTESTIVAFCDELYAHSKTVWKLWNETFGKYGFVNASEKPADEYSSELLLTLEDIGFLSVERRPIVDPEDAIDSDFWADDTESKKISLVFAVKEAIERYGAKKIWLEALKDSERLEKGKTIWELDAKGKFFRSGSTLYSPVVHHKVGEKY